MIPQLKIHLGGYADGHQFHDSFFPDSLPFAIEKMESSLKTVRNFCLIHNLKFNDEKTEVIVFGTVHQIRKMQPFSIKVGQSSVTPSKSVKNLGVIFDETLSMNEHITKICQKSNFQLIKLYQIRKYLTESACESIIHSFISSNLDYCNSLFINLPNYQLKRLQKIQNNAARCLTNTSKYDHITPILNELHWLTVEKRIEFKILLLTYRVLSGIGSFSLEEILHHYIPTRHLRTTSKKLLKMPMCRSRLADGCFAAAAPKLW